MLLHKTTRHNRLRSSLPCNGKQAVRSENADIKNKRGRGNRQAGHKRCGNDKSCRKARLHRQSRKGRPKRFFQRISPARDRSCDRGRVFSFSLFPRSGLKRGMRPKARSHAFSSCSCR